MNRYQCGKCHGPLFFDTHTFCPHCGVALRGTEWVDAGSFGRRQREWDEHIARRRAERKAQERRELWHRIQHGLRSWIGESAGQIRGFTLRIGERIGRTERDLHILFSVLESYVPDRDVVVRSKLEEHPSLARARDKNGKTAMHAAARYGSLDTIELLLSLKADVNARTKGGITPLHEAARWGNLALIKLLLACGANEKARSDERKGVVDYASPYYINAMNWLNESRPLSRPERKLKELKHAINPDIAKRKDSMGETLLHDVGRWGREDLAELLLMNGADVNTKAESTELTPLHYAARFGNVDVARVLLSHGASVNACSKLGVPLSLARRWNHKKMVSLLLTHGASQ